MADEDGLMKRWVTATIVCGVLAASIAYADRVQVYSVQGLDCADCGSAIKAELKSLKGVKKSEFDMQRVEVTVTMDDRVTDAAVLGAIARSGEGFKGIVGAGKGSYLPHEAYPKGADVRVLTESGAAVGPLEKLRVPGKVTVFDVYADWCGPCRGVDAQLREVTEHRKDIAVRKLNVVDFKSPLAREMGAKLKALPHVVVFSPSGRRTDLTGPSEKRLAAALGTR
jgi:copper chaperone CopZ